MRYDFLPPSRIVFGWGRLGEIGTLAQTLGQRAFLVCGSRTLDANGTIDEIESLLRRHAIETVRLTTTVREPEVEDVDRTVQRLRELRGDGDANDFVIGVGGGTAMDLAKAVAALSTQPGECRVIDFLEGVGTGRVLEAPPLPVMAVPTTAGTGAEATKNAVISSTAGGFKKSLRSDAMMPRIALVDPELTVAVPPNVTASTGMDAITQLIESFVSRRSQPIPRALCLQGLEGAVPALLRAYRDPGDRAARETMSQAALLSGMALANSGLGLAHGVAAALGIHCGVPHGLACAVMLPTAMRVNAEVCRADLVRLSPLLTGRIWKPDDAAVHAAIEQIEELNRQLGIPARLTALGVSSDQIPALAKASRGNSMSGNPRELTDDELTDLLERLL